jgi:hypothetical protein
VVRDAAEAASAFPAQRKPGIERGILVAIELSAFAAEIPHAGTLESAPSSPER